MLKLAFEIRNPERWLKAFVWGSVDVVTKLTCQAVPHFLQRCRCILPAAERFHPLQHFPSEARRLADLFVNDLGMAIPEGVMVLVKTLVQAFDALAQTRKLSQVLHIRKLQSSLRW